MPLTFNPKHDRVFWIHFFYQQCRPAQYGNNPKENIKRMNNIPQKRIIAV